MLIFRPRATILTLYGDYVRHRGGEIGIGGLIELLANFSLSEQSIRSAVSRMSRAGLFKVRHNGLRSYYSLTEAGFDLLDKGAQRIFERKTSGWDGTWSVVVYFIPEEKREARDKLRQELNWAGYGPLSTATWISPHDSSREIAEIIARLQIKEYVQMFKAKLRDFTNPQSIISRCWDLHLIHEKYASFLNEYSSKLEDYQGRFQDGEPIEASWCFVERFKLIHQYRRLPFFDPDLPEELLPKDWLRSQAADLFHQYHDLLAEKANEYFEFVFNQYNEPQLSNRN
ncbi:MAG: PaaX family transcriptional regulator C-terminal domain-containing protein [Dehalococcoidales bacterium]|nr:PaaX family transcriptional regulator C-terminal domain-containing protein [Dehalococcoidales bacterium]